MTRAAYGALLGLALLVGCTAGTDPADQAQAGTQTGTAAETGWTVTVYYTAVESFHSDPPVAVQGCLVLDCADGTDDLGSYPGDFVIAVKDEGAGRLTSGPHAGRYLNWSYDVGYWLDDVPRTSSGAALQPMVSAASDGLVTGAQVSIEDCGTEDGGSAVPRDVCDMLSAPNWVIDDEFTPGLGGDKHIDLYLGEEDTADFTEQPLYTTLTDAEISVRPPPSGSCGSWPSCED